MIQYRPMKPYRWTEITKETLKPLLARQVIHGEKMTLARIHLGKGSVVPLHSHVNEQMTIVEEGRLRFLLNGEEVLLEAGDMLLIPANALHLVEALEDSLALDIHSPCREDWIRGDDKYLR